MNLVRGLNLILLAVSLTTLSSCKVVFSTDDPTDIGSQGSCVPVQADATGAFHLSFPYAADGKLSRVHTIHEEPQNPTPIAVEEDQWFAPVGFAGVFTGEGRVNNLQLCVNNICPAIAIAPANYQFQRGTENHKINFGLYDLREGRQGAVGQISIRRAAVSGGGTGTTNSGGGGVVRKEICIQRIEFDNNFLSLNDWIAVPHTGGGTTPPGDGDSELALAEESIEPIEPCYGPHLEDGPNGGTRPPGCMPPIEPPRTRFGTFRGEVRIVTRNAGVIVLKDESVPPPPPPEDCVEVPLQNNTSYDFPFRSTGSLAIAQPAIGRVDEDGRILPGDPIGFYEGKGRAYEDCFWRDGHLCPAMPEVMPRYSFYRKMDDHGVRLNFHDIAPTGTSGRVNGFGRIQLSLKRVSEAIPSNVRMDLKNICVSGVDFRTSLSPMKPLADGKLRGDVGVTVKGLGRILLTDRKLNDEPVDNTVDNN